MHSEVTYVQHNVHYLYIFPGRAKGISVVPTALGGGGGQIRQEKGIRLCQRERCQIHSAALRKLTVNQSRQQKAVPNHQQIERSITQYLRNYYCQNLRNGSFAGYFG